MTHSPPGRDGQRRRRNSSRRRFLQVTAATGAVASLSGVSVAQDDEDNETDDSDGSDEQWGDVVTDGPTIGLELVGEGFTSPVGFEVAPGDDDRYFVVDQLGQIHVLEGASNGDGGPLQRRDEPFLDVSDRMVEVSGGTGEFDERGLLGLAFHPDFQENGRFFVRYSAPPTDDTPEDYDHTAVLAEFTTADDEHSTADPESEERLLEVPEPQFNHNAGAVLFGPDGYLYVPLGDGGNADDVGLGHVEDWYDENDGGNAQNTTDTLLGGIHRIDVDADGDGDRPYGIPDDNPFVESDAGFDEYYAWGLRNPWRLSFDSEGNFYVADVGQNLFEEVNIVENGGNYGWNVKEGIECFSTENPGEPGEDCPNATPEDVRGGEDLLDPVIQYPHLVDGESFGISITGGYVYEGEAASELQDMYVYGDWSRGFGSPDGSLFASPVAEYEPSADRSEDDLWEIQELSVSDAPNDRINRFVLAFGRDHDDELYVLTTARYTDGETGEVWRIVPEGEGETIEPHEDAVGSEEEADDEDSDGEEDDEMDDDAADDDGGDNETDDESVDGAGNETVDGGNESVDDGTDNESIEDNDGNESAGNESGE
ncbi:PQQ-dependent sugar dehydrogenase [Halovivax cerinus]|uniref:PQQ-dependent sugar dehydrogenase n=1 Tax=Halovivax cerinus TaxID=1487865 RepID=A0ABD5NJL0_9EURY|nr:PQQ-dependent sugar dehydrogenase [Halovivax cerinus]